jgi:CRISPR/Cas system-associated exonuclease Cas4 (RecB family)
VDALEPSADISILETDADPPPVEASSTDSRDNDVLTLDRPVIAGQYDSAVNVTSLAVFAECPRKYYLQRYIGWNTGNRSRFDPTDLPKQDLPERDDADETAADLGSAVHEILAGKPGSYSTEAQRLADVFLTSDIGTRAASASRIEREWDFIVDVEGTLVRGTVDLWFEEKGEIIMVDYKTDRSHDSAGSYTPQLALYGLAIERAFGKRPVGAWLHFLRSNKLVEVTLDDSAIHNVVQLRTAQDTLQFDLNEGDHCRACEFYRGLCPAGLSTNASPAPQAAQTPSQSAAGS